MMFRATGVRNLGAAERDLKSGNPRVRASAAADMARHAGAHPGEVTRALLAALSDEAAEVRAAAALGLAEVGAEHALSPLLDALDDDDLHVREMALTALGELGESRAAARVARELSAGHPALRFQALIAYARVAEPEPALEALLAATEDDDPLVVHIALRMSEELGGDEGVDPRMLARARALCAHASDVVRVAAAVVLGRAGLRAGTDILVEVAAKRLSTSEAEDEAAAVELCGELGLSEAVPALELRAFGGVLSREPFAWHARVALAALEHPRAVRWVLGELGAWTRERRTLAVAAAGRARLAAARPLLEAMRGRADRAEPEAVEEALAELSGQGAA